VSWGRWIGGATIDGSPWSGFQTLAYVVGLPSPIADITSMSGSFTFNLIGWTAPTDGTNLGTVTGGQLVGTFGPTPTVAINNFTFNVAGNSYNLTTAASPIPVSTGGPYAPFSAGFVPVTGTACASGCNAQVNGHFMGAGATHAGFSYSVANFAGPPVVGAAAFKR
jgi:hypothetical protein